MRSKIQSYCEIFQNLKLNYPILPKVEFLFFTVQIERNQISENAFVISYSNSTHLD